MTAVEAGYEDPNFFRRLFKRRVGVTPARYRQRFATILILDNYAANKHAKVRAWLERHPRWTFHFTPTSASWLNAVEGFFAKFMVAGRDDSFGSPAGLDRRHNFSASRQPATHCAVDTQSGTDAAPTGEA